MPDCDIVINDNLVSRMHARIGVNEEGVWLEDLHSTNGVFVNGVRLLKAVALRVGDRALVGSHEISFFESRTDPAPSAREPHSSRPLALPVVAPEPAVSRLPQPSDYNRDIPTTTRADALRLVGSLGRRLAEEGKLDEAVRVLSPHLRGILRGAASGLELPEPLSQLASDLALDLAHWTSEPIWLDYIVELHLVSKRLMSRQTVIGLQRSERWLGAMDRLLLQYYVESLAVRLRDLNAEQKATYALLRLLLKA